MQQSVQQLRRQQGLSAHHRTPLQYDPSQNDAAECNFHPGAPLFHEGLKSYSCCNTINKPVMTFDEFLKLPGCTTGSHSSEKTEVKAPVVTAKVQENNVETVASSVVDVPLVASTSTLSAGPTVYKSRPTSPNPPTSNGSSAPSAVLLEEQDPVDAVVPEGTKCKRAACGCAYTMDMERTDSECLYHPLPAIFHEGSKGYACCKRRVLEFDEFLKIEGCKKGRHLFVGQPKAGVEMVTCRSDMYQTPTQVGRSRRRLMRRADISSGHCFSVRKTGRQGKIERQVRGVGARRGSPSTFKQAIHQIVQLVWADQARGLHLPDTGNKGRDHPGKSRRKKLAKSGGSRRKAGFHPADHIRCTRQDRHRRIERHDIQWRCCAFVDAQDGHRRCSGMSH